MSKKTNKNKVQTDPQKVFLFGKRNYQIMALGILFIALGFILMAGGGSEDPNVFNEEIFSTSRLTIAPILIVIGWIIEVFAIMIKPKERELEV